MASLTDEVDPADSLVPRFSRVGALPCALILGAFPVTAPPAATGAPTVPSRGAVAVTGGIVGGGVGAGVTGQEERERKNVRISQFA